MREAEEEERESETAPQGRRSPERGEYCAAVAERRGLMHCAVKTVAQTQTSRISDLHIDDLEPPVNMG